MNDVLNTEQPVNLSADAGGIDPGYPPAPIQYNQPRRPRDYGRHLSHCPCGHPLFFSDSLCEKCGTEVGFDPIAGGMQILSAGPDGSAPRFRRCGNAGSTLACNWLIESESSSNLCLSCALTRICPNLSQPENQRRWMQIESAKRRVLAAVLDLGLPLTGLHFDFLETTPGAAPILTGHSNGLITLNVEEADDDVRERIRTHFREPYRTLIGHLRHELGHFYWNQVIVAPNQLDEFRSVFGDESVDYNSALQTYHSQGPQVGWENSFVSAYATAHPHEDWAETFAHYLHMREGLASADALGLQFETERLAADPFPDSAAGQTNESCDSEFFQDVNRWCVISKAMNELNRTMGQPDFYPFTLSPQVVQKLHFVHRVICNTSLNSNGSSHYQCCSAA